MYKFNYKQLNLNFGGVTGSHWILIASATALNKYWSRIDMHPIFYYSVYFLVAHAGVMLANARTHQAEAPTTLGDQNTILKT